jgi:phosphoribosylamine--glycine ligase
VIEFNCRFGDPETQPIMMRLQSDLDALCLSAITQDLHNTDARWDPRPALGVVLASEGYPGSYRKGDVISGLEPSADADTKVFHAGTALVDDQVVTSGGRVLCVTALGDDIKSAQANAYLAADGIDWPGKTLRRDIGWRAIARYSSDDNR